MGNNLVVKVDGLATLPVPPARQARYAPYKNKAMILGMRPEHLIDWHDGAKPGVVKVDVLVDVVEPMGMETMIHFLVGGCEMSARVDPTTRAAPGEVLPLAADMNHMHLMDPDSGRVV
jgi:multiple sugar transport system ATP-binding protein